MFGVVATMRQIPFAVQAALFPLNLKKPSLLCWGDLLAFCLGKPMANEAFSLIVWLCFGSGSFGAGAAAGNT
jgi:hypothetical protein